MPSTLAHSGLKAASVRVGQTLCTSNARKAAVFVMKTDAWIAIHVVVLGRDGNTALTKNTRIS